MTDEPPKHDHFPIHTLEELYAFEDPEALIEVIMFKDSVCEIYGKPETGKSLVALSMTHSISRGKEWMGLQCKQADALYIFGEGRSGIKKRFKALENKYGPAGDVRFLSSAINLKDFIDCPKLISQLNEMSFKPGFIVIDTLARCFGGGDENSTQDMGKFVSNVDVLQKKTGATILIVHHSGKDRAKEERGSSSLRAAMDTVIEVSGNSGSSNKLITFKCKKQKDADHFADLKLMFSAVDLGSGINSAVLQPCAGNKSNSGNESDLNLLENEKTLLKYFLKQAVPIKAKKCIEDLKTQISEATVNRRLKGLVETGILDKDEVKALYWLSAKGKQIAITINSLSNPSHDSDHSHLSLVSPPLKGDTDDSHFAQLDPDFGENL